jgi:hypothetical protein
MPLPPPPPPPVPGTPLPPDPIQSATTLVLRSDIGIVRIFHIENEAGVVVAQGHRSTEGIVEFMEMLVTDPGGRFLLAFRLKNRPGRPFIQVNIPYVVVDDQGRTVGELGGRHIGLTQRTYTLWSQGEEYLAVPSASSSAPYPLLQRGAPVAMISEEKPLLTDELAKTWTLTFTAPCVHLHAIALLTHVAGHRGAAALHAG